MLDPITGRFISAHCWNGLHEALVHYPGYGTERSGCVDRDCGCLCHPRNQVETTDPVPNIDDVCGMCLGTGEIALGLTNYGPCPACFARLANTPKETA